MGQQLLARNEELESTVQRLQERSSSSLAYISSSSLSLSDRPTSTSSNSLLASSSPHRHHNSLSSHSHEQAYITQMEKLNAELQLQVDSLRSSLTHKERHYQKHVLELERSLDTVSSQLQSLTNENQDLRSRVRRMAKERVVHLRNNPKRSVSVTSSSDSTLSATDDNQDPSHNSFSQVIRSDDTESQETQRGDELHRSSHSFHSETATKVSDELSGIWKTKYMELKTRYDELCHELERFLNIHQVSLLKQDGVQVSSDQYTAAIATDGDAYPEIAYPISGVAKDESEACSSYLPVSTHASDRLSGSVKDTTDDCSPLLAVSKNSTDDCSLPLAATDDRHPPLAVSKDMSDGMLVSNPSPDASKHILDRLYIGNKSESNSLHRVGKNPALSMHPFFPRTVSTRTMACQTLLSNDPLPNPPLLHHDDGDCNGLVQGGTENELDMDTIASSEMVMHVAVIEALGNLTLALMMLPFSSIARYVPFWNRKES